MARGPARAATCRQAGRALLIGACRRDTRAVALPPVLPGLTALTSLDLSDNPFEALAGLPDGLQALSTVPNLQVWGPAGGGLLRSAASHQQVPPSRV